jgi:hypothetical protein
MTATPSEQNPQPAVTESEHHLHCDCVDSQNDQYQKLCQEVSDIHAFIDGLATALNHPMVKAMLPPHMREMLH